MFADDLTELPPDSPILLDNTTCPYCGVELAPENNTKEHVIGRRFVPKGVLNGCWNLIVRACSDCNSIKSILENDISAITLVGKSWFGTGDQDEKELGEARRKAKGSKSLRTGKLVEKSQEEVDFKVPFGRRATLSFNMVSPPQIDRDRVYDLARMQMMAFFYFLTFHVETKKGRFWSGGFYLIDEAHCGDWGNSLQVSFMTRVCNWEPMWVGTTAEGYFKSIIRKHPQAACWSWAIEWNKNYRVVGFFGDADVVQEIVDELEFTEMSEVPTHDQSRVRYRTEVALSEEDDILFSFKNA